MNHLQIKRRLKNYVGLVKAVVFYKTILNRRIQQARDIEDSHFLLPYIEMRITTRCNMKCKKCGHLIPCYQSDAKDLTFDEFKVQFDNLINAVTYINVFSLVGGETMLSKYIYEILGYVMASNKIGEIRVVSNGKEIPPIDFLKFISDTRVCMHFSQYIQHKDNYPTIRDLCKEYHVSAHFYGGDSFEQVWYDYGEVKKYHYSDQQLAYTSYNCYLGFAKQYCNGMLFSCPRINNAYELGLIDIPESELCRITDDVEESRKNIIKFYSMPYSYGCKYCNAPKSLDVAAAEQME